MENHKAPLRDDQIAAGDSPFGWAAETVRRTSHIPQGWYPLAPQRRKVRNPSRPSISSPALNIKVTTHGNLRHLRRHSGYGHQPARANSGEDRGNGCSPARDSDQGRGRLGQGNREGRREAGRLHRVTSPRLPSLPTPLGEGIKSHKVGGHEKSNASRGSSARAIAGS